MNQDEKNGLLLKGFRKQNLLTLQEVADKLEKSVRTVQYWESGRRIPNEEIDKINKLFSLQLKPSKVEISPKISQEDFPKIYSNDALSGMYSGYKAEQLYKLQAAQEMLVYLIHDLDFIFSNEQLGYKNTVKQVKESLAKVKNSYDKIMYGEI